MKTLIKTTITLAAIGVAVKVIKKDYSKVYFGQKKPSNTKSGELWMDVNTAFKLADALEVDINEFRKDD